MTLTQEQIDAIRQKIAGSGIKIDFDSVKIDYYIQLATDEIEKNGDADLSAAFKPEQATVIIEVIKAIVFPAPPAPKEADPVFDALTAYHLKVIAPYLDEIEAASPGLSDEEKIIRYKKWFREYMVML